MARILIAIPTHKRPAQLRKCLESIGRLNGVTDHQIRLFVADNDPAGREGLNLAQEIATSFRYPLTATVVDEPGISAVRNAILDEASKGGIDFIAMIDDDETASPEWLSSLMAVQKSYDADVVAGPVISEFEIQPPADVERSPLFQRSNHATGPIPRINATGNVLFSCRGLYKTEWPRFRQDFGLTGGGDSEYFTRMAGRWSYAWAADAAVYELVSQDRSNRKWVLKRSFRVGNSEIRIALMHGSRLNAALRVAKSLLTIAYAPALLYSPRRLWVLSKWWRAAGKLSALGGKHYSEYANRH